MAANPMLLRTCGKCGDYYLIVEVRRVSVFETTARQQFHTTLPECFVSPQLDLVALRRLGHLPKYSRIVQSANTEASDIGGSSGNLRDHNERATGERIGYCAVEDHRRPWRYE
jgi:hypothetical protein